MKDRLFRFRRLAVAALTGATVFGGAAVIGAGQASATTSGVIAGAEAPLFVNAGANNQAASPELVQLPNTFVAGDTLTFQVEDNSGVPNCTVANESIGFSAVPTVTVTTPSANSSSDTAPTITAALSTGATEPNCTAQSVKDLLTLTITNTASGTAGDKYDITISGIKYNVGSAAAAGNVGVSFNAGAFNTTSGDNTTSGFATLDGAMSNASVELVAVAANVPPIGVNEAAPSYTATNVGISPVTITENAAGIIGSTGSWVCVTLSNAPTIDTTTVTPTASVSGGGAAVSSSAVTISGSTISFQVTTPSSTGPATYTLSGIHVDTSNTGFSFATVKINGTAATSCTAATTLAETPAAFDGIETFRVFGATVDDTAAAEEANNIGCDSNMVLARDDAPYDALGGAYLAGALGTGTLLTPGGSDVTSASNAALNAIRTEGVQTVYVLGGPLAISDAVVSQLQSTPSYTCGGTTVRSSGGVTQMLRVIRIYGQTQDGTAAAVAQYFGAGFSSSSNINMAGAYTGAYNDTTGVQSASAPKNTSLETAILAVDNGWQDATSAGPAAWADEIPVVLTPGASLGTDAQNALINLGIQQVIVMGGPLAISDTVVTQLQAMGITVLRVAGQDYTDTSQLFARFFATDQTNTNGDSMGLGFDDSDIVLARGDYFGDSLAGAVVGGEYGEPILLTLDPNTLGQYLTAYLNAAGTSLGADGISGSNTFQTILGGNLAVSNTTVQNDLNAVSAGNDA